MSLYCATGPSWVMVAPQMCIRDRYYEPRNAEKVVKALRMTHREDLIPRLVPAEGRRAVQRSARRAEAADVTIHQDGTYSVRPHSGKTPVSYTHLGQHLAHPGQTRHPLSDGSGAGGGPCGSAPGPENHQI